VSIRRSVLARLGVRFLIALAVLTLMLPLLSAVNGISRAAVRGYQPGVVSGAPIALVNRASQVRVRSARPRVRFAGSFVDVSRWGGSGRVSTEQAGTSPPHRLHILRM
jgi:hypothetical protein